MLKFAIAALMAVHCSASTYRFQGTTTWQTWSARHKWERMVTELEADTTGVLDYHWADMADLFKQRSNRTTCATTQDEMPGDDKNDELTGRRQKLIHTLGVVGTVELEPVEGSPYTGLFQGANYGIVRLSDGGFLHEGMTTFDPSAAMKFFVDGQKSRNLLARANMAGTSDPYFFAQPFSNHPPGADDMSDCAKETRNKKMGEATKFIFSTGTSKFAEVTENGEGIDDEDEVFPFELIWEPNQTAFPDSSDDFFTYFANNKGGDETLLFTLRAWANPCEENVDCDRIWQDAPIIARINLTSELYRSTFGDERLFFVHETFNRDTDKFSDTDTQRRKQWRNSVDQQKQWIEGELTYPILEMPTDQDPRDVILNGIHAVGGCPFQWLLDATQ